jgi:hypothetical protein
MSEISSERVRATGRRRAVRLVAASLAAAALAAPFTWWHADPDAVSRAAEFVGARTPGEVHVGWAAPGRAVPENLIGLSVEWPLLAHDLGPGGVPPAALVDLMRRLGRPPLRIGGDSQDRMWPTAAGAPPGATWTPTPSFWAGLRRLDEAIRGPVQVGLDMAHDNPRAALAVGRAAARSLPAGRVTFSLGNEPDRYGVQSWARLPSGRLIRARGDAWSFARYLRQYLALRRALAGLGPLVGPDFADGHWRSSYGVFVAATRPAAATIHAYPLNVCGKRPGSPRWPTSHALLAPSAWAGKVRTGIAWAGAVAARARVPLVVSEANSVACRGARGVSDGPAAALWAPAFLFSAAQAGAAQVDFHASGSPYDPFHVVWEANGTADVQPTALFDGLAFARRALAGPAPRLLPVRTAPAGGPAWAVRTSDGSWRVLVENLDARPAVTHIQAPRPSGAVDVLMLTRSGRDAAGHERMAAGGAILAGAHGRLVTVGRRVGLRAGVHRGLVRITLAPRSAAIITGTR